MGLISIRGTGDDQADIEIGAELAEFGVNEDGRQIIAERLMVVVTLGGGVRYRHPYRFSTIEIEINEEGFRYAVGRHEAAEAEANRLIERIKEAGAIDPDRWGWDPVYCSPAYAASGEEFRRLLEEHAAG